jgi:hypothetical protein
MRIHATGMKLRREPSAPGRRFASPGPGLLKQTRRAGRACVMGREPATLIGRPCDLPGCASSANP